MVFAKIRMIPVAVCRAGDVAFSVRTASNGMRGVMILAGVMIGLGTVMAQIADHMMAASATTAPSAMLVAAESPTPASGVRSVVVPRDRHGHFQTEGRIEGQRITFMVDTGASVVAMNETSAARIGVRPARGEFNAKVTTANGVIKAARTRLAMVQIGDLVVRDVDAMVLPDEALSQNLLGLSFLGKLKRFEFASGRMVLEQ